MTVFIIALTLIIGNIRKDPQLRAAGQWFILQFLLRKDSVILLQSASLL